MSKRVDSTQLSLHPNQKAFLEWDWFRGHFTDALKDFLARRNVYIAVIPGGLTPVLQPQESKRSNALDGTKDGAERQEEGAVVEEDDEHENEFDRQRTGKTVLFEHTQRLFLEPLDSFQNHQI